MGDFRAIKGRLAICHFHTHESQATHTPFFSWLFGRQVVWGRGRFFQHLSLSGRNGGRPKPSATYSNLVQANRAYSSESCESTAKATCRRFLIYDAIQISRDSFSMCASSAQRQKKLRTINRGPQQKNLKMKKYKRREIKLKKIKLDEYRIYAKNYNTQLRVHKSRHSSDNAFFTKK